MHDYSNKVMEHFSNPRNAGLMEDAQGTGEIGDPNCGDFMKVFVKVEDNVLTDVKYQIKGCPASIACASVMTELAIGKGLDDAMMICDNDIVEALDGLPEAKLHCSNLSASALQKAIYDYFTKYISKAGVGT